MNRKAQVTVFILVGIIIVSAFSFLFFIQRSLTKTKLDAEADKILDDLLQTTVVESYITRCLDRVSEEGIILLGRQGGMLYPWQKNEVLSYWDEYVPFEDIYFPQRRFNVSYQIGDPFLTKGIFDPPGVIEAPLDRTPWYPCPCFNPPCDHTHTNPCSFDYRRWAGELSFGFLPLAQFNVIFPLYRAETVEKYGILLYPGWATEEEIGILENSVQRQLEQYIQNATKECVNFSAFASLLDYNITEGNISAEVIFAEDDVAIDLEYDVNINVRNKEPIVRILNFRAKHNIRFKEIYEILFLLTREENENLTYSVEQGFYEIIEEKGITGLNISIYPNRFDPEAGTQFNDIFVIIDRENFINDKPYVFQFARANRFPILNYVSGSPTGTPAIIRGQKYDYNVPLGSILRISPYGLDPDSDDITYSYSGWRENYLDEFNMTDFYIKNCSYFPERCMERQEITNPHDWTESQAFTQTDREANITTDAADIGFHIVNVTVSDNEYEDWQEVRILVVDSPTARANGHNPYSDIGNDKASIEDPFWLDASASSAFFCINMTYHWTDEFEYTLDNHTLYKGPLDFIRMPLLVDILNMTGRANPFNNCSYPEVSLAHDVSLTVESDCGLPTSDSMDIMVYQCLPHRNYSFPFPYHNLSEDDPFTRWRQDLMDPEDENNTIWMFQANHTCCSNGTDIIGEYGEYAPETTECYRFEQYVCRMEDSLISLEHLAWIDTGIPRWPGTDTPSVGELVNPIFWFEGFQTSQPAEDATDNDIYFRTFSVMCNGTSGNVCSGDKSDDWEHNETCTRCQRCGFGERDCLNWTDDYYCKRDPVDFKCTDDSGFFDPISTPTDRISAPFCNGLGNETCNTTPTYSSYIKSDNYVDDRGILDRSGGSIVVSVNCNRYDRQTGPSPGTIGDISYDRINADQRTGVVACDIASGQDGCFSSDQTCNINDCCTTRNYTCTESPFLGCEMIEVDLDKGSYWCVACTAQNTVWRPGGEEIGFGEYPGTPGADGCCGDDYNEWDIPYVANEKAYGSIYNRCCDNPDDCSSGLRCFADGDSTDDLEGADSGDIDHCVQGVWYDPDDSQSECEAVAVSGVWEFDDDWDQSGENNRDGDWSTPEGTPGMCCGDDASVGEGNQILECNSAGGDTVVCGLPIKNSCCDDNTDCVNANSECFSNGIAEGADSHDVYEWCDGATNTWYDPDEDQNYCPNNWDLYPGGIIDGPCCGDDSGEAGMIRIECSSVGDETVDCPLDGRDACCVPQECVDTSSNCVNPGRPGGFTNDEYESCRNSQWHDPDESRFDCNHYDDDDEWDQVGEGNLDIGDSGIPAGSVGMCCGDDGSEADNVIINTQGDYNTYSDSCCDDENHCVYDSQCYDTGVCFNTKQSSGGDEVCDDQEWHSREDSPNSCIACGSDYVWTDQGENKDCCKNDPFENFIDSTPFAGGTTACCEIIPPATQACAWTDLNLIICNSEGHEGGGGAQGICSDGVDNDCDNMCDAVDNACGPGIPADPDCIP